MSQASTVKCWYRTDDAGSTRCGAAGRTSECPCPVRRPHPMSFAEYLVVGHEIRGYSLMASAAPLRMNSPGGLPELLLETPMVREQRRNVAPRRPARGMMALGRGVSQGERTAAAGCGTTCEGKAGVTVTPPLACANVTADAQDHARRIVFRRRRLLCNLVPAIVVKRSALGGT